MCHSQLQYPKKARWTWIRSFPSIGHSWKDRLATTISMNWKIDRWKSDFCATDCKALPLLNERTNLQFVGSWCLQNVTVWYSRVGYPLAIVLMISEDNLILNSPGDRDTFSLRFWVLTSSHAKSISSRKVRVRRISGSNPQVFWSITERGSACPIGRPRWYAAIEVDNCAISCLKWTSSHHRDIAESFLPGQ
jgi:hypothetical protein